MSNIWFAIALTMLGSEGFEERERGQALLVAGLPFSMQVVRHGLLSSDPEVVRRCREVEMEHNNWVARRLELKGIPAGWYAAPMIRFVDCSDSERASFRLLAIQEGVKDTGQWSFEIDRRATQLFVESLLAKPGNGDRLSAILESAKKAETRWHLLSPVTTIPDRPENVPTRAVNRLP